MGEKTLFTEIFQLSVHLRVFSYNLLLGRGKSDFFDAIAGAIVCRTIMHRNFELKFSMFFATYSNSDCSYLNFQMSVPAEIPGRL